ncbi:succinate dehydrogenase cytochrome b subunit [Trueperella pecoris]|uniref:Succinate dehydrogenase cytochrome b subunit n=1 Tax=Trueperella pecoris TaxID=2733571 RepID=A0A7M1R1T2_9ACTO|nr:succinate dehydrogenase cytochrome b subunit [Trueperella pecoris]QOR48250.1 succinate dehydrogenase cytochrome b subunit [Trueperella pecoris]
MQLKAPPSWALKVTMAVTGAIWAIFVLIHLYGNLKVYMGPQSFDGYAHWLRGAFYPLVPKLGVLWIMRVVLGVCLILHVWAATLVYLRGRKFRGKYRARKLSGLQALSARLMPATGILILGFLVVHLLDLTVGATPIATDSFQGPTAGASAAYSNLVASFDRPAMAIFYAAIMVFLAIHVAHGAFNLAVDFGSMGARLRSVFVWVGALAAIAILLANASIPLAVQMGWLS